MLAHSDRTVADVSIKLRLETTPTTAFVSRDWRLMRDMLGLTVAEMTYWSGCPLEAVVALEGGSAATHEAAWYVFQTLASFLAGSDARAPGVLDAYERLAALLGEHADVAFVWPLPHGW